MTPNDQHLIFQLRQGKTKALEALHKRYAHRIFGACLQFHLTAEDAEEIVQDVFVKVWENRMELKLGYSFRSYLFTIAKNCVLKYARKKVIHHTIEHYINQRPGTATNLEQEMIFNEAQAQLETLIDNLPPKKQKIYLLSHCEGLPHKEIADKLGISVRTVESHTYQINALIKQKLGLN
jgi:RNA polymerase sigma-70 factor (ECF subfamily)